MENKDYCVYCHTFPNGKRYIGITCQDVNKRWDNGWGYMRAKTTPMARAVKKYGWANIQHEILHSDLSEEEAKAMEIYYITEVFHSNNPDSGYNLTAGGDGLRGWSHSEETKLKMSGAAKGREFSDSHIENLRRSHLGYVMPQSQKDKIGASCRKAVAEGRGHIVPVKCIEDDLEFMSITAAAKHYGISTSSISNTLTGSSKTAGGRHWERIQ